MPTQNLDEVVNVSASIKKGWEAGQEALKNAPGEILKGGQDAVDKTVEDCTSAREAMDKLTKKQI